MGRNSTRRVRGGPACGAVLAAALLAGCAAGAPAASSAEPAAVVYRPATPYHGTEVPVSRPRLTLPDTAGRPFSLADRPRGEVTVVFFGYTHCPDLCPTTMADLAAARRTMPAAVRERVRVVFVTEDPERDTPAVLRDWLDRFDPSFLGLAGGNQATAEVLRVLRLPASKTVATPTPAVIHPEDGHEHPAAYGLDHAGTVYVFGPQATLVYTGGTTPEEFARDLTLLAR